jgi:hypothetical protein
MAKKLKGWLRRNKLTAKDETDYYIVIETYGSVTPKEIIAELVKEGMEVKPETALNIVTRYNRKSLDLLLGGCNVNTGLVRMRLVAKGVAHGKTWDPKHNSLSVSITQGAEMRAAVADTPVEIMGELSDPMVLYGITALPADEADDTLKRGFGAELKGEFIKIVGDDESCGVYFRNPDTLKEIKLEKRHITVNEPSRLMIIVPATIEPGMYELSVTTQYSSGPPLKQLRTESLRYPVEVV